MSLIGASGERLPFEPPEFGAQTEPPIGFVEEPSLIPPLAASAYLSKRKSDIHQISLDFSRLRMASSFSIITLSEVDRCQFRFRFPALETLLGA